MAISNLQITNADGQVITGGNAGTTAIKVKADANLGSVEKTSSLTFSGAGATKTVTVTQAAAPVLLQTTDGETSVTLNAAATSHYVELNVKANSAYVAFGLLSNGTTVTENIGSTDAAIDLVTEDENVHVHEGSADLMGTLATAPCPLTSERDATEVSTYNIKLPLVANTSADSELVYHYKIYASKNTTFTLASKSIDVVVTLAAADATLSVDPDPIALAADGGEEDVTVTTNGAWTVAEA